MENPYFLVSKLLEEIESRRVQDVVRRRFGLASGRPQTLQEIGDDYNITRERVRQIEKNGLDYLSRPSVQEKIKSAENELRDYFKQHGDLRREEKALDDLVCYCMPENQVAESLSRQNNETLLCRAALNLILTLGKSFIRMAETEDFHPFWTVNESVVPRAKKTIDSAIKFFDKNRRVLTRDELYRAIKKDIGGISDKAAYSYVDASKLIEQNNFGEFGLIDWPEISPRGVRDKAYLILKKEGKPFHFTAVTNLINQLLPHQKPAYVQTVHNELIKDQRFVLIGRGIYALSEWGYEPGTVIDVIKSVLKEKGSLAKEEIIKNVLAKRLIKENTILINLQNKKYFKKLADGKFVIAQ